ncbi:hypothetical protein GTN66_01320 [bacterium]|nr:hypothetical protein [bacterium]NIN91798.1 hypothetical protein [bacterium]NIO18084.1 hypothetical protein [bacterium]NIO73049.1 hypothetical protein [bacterium]
MRENVKILMEETGCDEGQAELALHSTGDNLEKAIKSIDLLLKYIVVIKGKFICSQTNVYGQFIVISHLNQKRVVRLSAIVTYDPGIYEGALDCKWRDFEKRLYADRLSEGCAHELIQKLEQNLNWQIASDYRKSFFQNLKDRNYEEITAILQSIVGKSLEDSQLKVEMNVEELNLNQFKFPQESTILSEGEVKPYLNETQEPVSRKEGAIVLKTELVTDTSSSSVEIEKLKKNDLILVKILDSRDIAKYLSRLLGGCKGEEVVPLSTIVEEVRTEGERWAVRTRFSPGILGETLVEKKTKVRRLKPQKFTIENKKLYLGIFVLALIAGLIFYVLLHK